MDMCEVLRKLNVKKDTNFFYMVVLVNIFPFFSVSYYHVPCAREMFDKTVHISNKYSIFPQTLGQFQIRGFKTCFSAVDYIALHILCHCQNCRNKLLDKVIVA